MRFRCKIYDGLCPRLLVKEEFERASMPARGDVTMISLPAMRAARRCRHISRQHTPKKVPVSFSRAFKRCLGDEYLRRAIRARRQADAKFLFRASFSFG